MAADDLRLHLLAEERAASAAVPPILRCAAFNPVNALANDVLGQAIGGEPRLAAAAGAVAWLHSTVNGRAERALLAVGGASGAGGDGRLAPATLTALACYGRMVFAGSTDGALRAWDGGLHARWDGRRAVESPFEWEDVVGNGGDDVGVGASAAARRRAASVIWAVASQHGCAVTALAATAEVLASAGAGAAAVLLTDATSGVPLRRLQAHAGGVGALAVAGAVLASGGADGVVSVWALLPGAAAGVALLRTLDGHGAPITALYVTAGGDIVSGDARGDVILWAPRAPAPAARVSVHAPAAVRLLQADTARIVSVGADGALAVTDAVQAAVMQFTRAPHAGARVLALQADANTLVTAAADRSLRVWAWRDGRFAARPRDAAPRAAEHVVRAGETVGDIATRHGLPEAELRSLNARLGSTFFPGMRLALLAGSGGGGGGGGDDDDGAAAVSSRSGAGSKQAQRRPPSALSRAASFCRQQAAAGAAAPTSDDDDDDA